MIESELEKSCHVFVGRPRKACACYVFGVEDRSSGTHVRKSSHREEVGPPPIRGFLFMRVDLQINFTFQAAMSELRGELKIEIE